MNGKGFGLLQHPEFRAKTFGWGRLVHSTDANTLSLVEGDRSLDVPISTGSRDAVVQSINTGANETLLMIIARRQRLG